VPETASILKRKIHALEAELEAHKKHAQQLELVIQSTGVGIWDWSIPTGEVVFNERWARIIGYKLQELEPVNIDTWVAFAHPDDLDESNRLLQEHWEGKSEYYIFESRMKHKNGEWIWVLDTGQVIERDENGAPKRMIGTHLDITDKKDLVHKLEQANTELQALSYLDPLTKIPNRRAYEERILLEIRSAKRARHSLALMIIDIDCFKEYNDHYGHAAGDIALYRVAQALCEELPRKTDFIARYGGEEFVVILPASDDAGVAKVADRLIKKVSSERITHAHSSTSDVITLSIGIASTTSDYDLLFERADKAMYRAKRDGRGRYQVFNDNDGSDL